MSLWSSSNDRRHGVKTNDSENDFQGLLFTPETVTTAFTTPDLSFKDILVDYEDEENNHAVDDPVDAFFTAGDSVAFDRPEFYGWGGIAIEDSHRPFEALHSDHLGSLQIHDGDPIYTLSPVVLDDPLPTLSLPGASSSPPAQLPVALPPSAFQQPHGQHEMTEYMRAKLSLPSDVPVDLRSVPNPSDHDERPPATLEILICLAICSSDKKMLPLQDIHQAIAARFPYYTVYTKWQGSIRHALSLYSIFKMHKREEGDRGRGNFWTLDIVRAEQGRYKRPRTRSDGAKKKKPSHLRNADDDSDAATEVRIRSASSSHSTRTRLEQARGISSPAVAALGNNRDRSAVLSSGARDLQGPIRASRTLRRQASANPTALTASPGSVEAGARRAGGRAGSGKQPRHGGKVIL